MTQNIYDRPDFFRAYVDAIDQPKADLSNNLAWSRLRKLVPESVAGLRILDLGCGSGWFCRWARDNGAQSVLGIDVSEKMLERARDLTEQGEHTDIHYRRADLDALHSLPDREAVFAPGSYDLIFSSLVLHYLVNLSDLLDLVHRALKPGALFVFNVEHPIYTAPFDPRVVDMPDTGEQCWAFKDYYREGERVVDWLAPGVRKQHRSLTGYMQLFLSKGFDIAGFTEWLPTEDELREGKVDKVEELRPLFLMTSIRTKLK